MDVDKAKDLFDEIVELCHETQNPRLIEIVGPIYRDVERAEDVSTIIILAEDLQVHLNEIELLPDEEDPVQDMHEKIEKLSE